MGKVIRFWPRKTGADRLSWHGMDQRPPRLPRYLRNQDDEVTLAGVAHETVLWLGRFVVGGVAIGTGMLFYDPALIDPPEFLTGNPEQVSEVFSRCGLGRSHACVIDGDTFKLGDRKVRIIGIDAPETHPARCAEEARLGEEATAKLLVLLNQGAFEMVAPIYRTQDRYGRDLRVIRRKLPDGRMQSIASDMRESGLAYRYLGGFKMDWC